jgi:hypothetical protein
MTFRSDSLRIIRAKARSTYLLGQGMRKKEIWALALKKKLDNLQYDKSIYDLANS